MRKNSSVRPNSFRPMVELLESRELLAGGIGTPPPVFAPLPAPMVQFASQPFKVLSGGITSGAQAPVASWKISVGGHGVASFDHLGLVSIGSAQAYSNTSGFSLYGDLNHVPGDGPRKDGYETFLGSAQATYPSDVADITLSRKLYVVGGLPVNVLAVANFSTYLYGGDSFGVYAFQADFSGPRGDVIPDANVSYTGVPPVLQQVNPDVVIINQSQMPNASLGLVAGQKDVLLAQGYLYSNTPVSLKEVFTAAQGTSLQNFTNLRLRYITWDGVADLEVPGTVTNGKLAFSFAPDYQHSGMWKIVGDVKPILNTATANLKLQLTVCAGATTAMDLATNTPMKGVAVNGGAGQIQVSANPSFSTVYTISTNPSALSAILSADNAIGTSGQGGQEVVAAKFDVVTGSNTVTGWSISVPLDASGFVSSATLWDGATLLGTATFNPADGTANFTGLNIGPNTAKTFTVKLVTLVPPMTANVKVTLKSLGILNSQGIASTIDLNVNGNDMWIYNPQGGIG